MLPLPCFRHAAADAADFSRCRYCRVIFADADYELMPMLRQDADTLDADAS